MTLPVARADLVVEWFDDACLVLDPTTGRVTRLDGATGAFLVALDGAGDQAVRDDLARALGDGVDVWIEQRLALFDRLEFLHRGGKG